MSEPAEVDFAFWDELEGVDEETIARMFYKLEGWEKYWPYEKRPQWLRRKYP